MPSVFIPQYQKRGFPVPTSKQAKKHTYISVIIVERFDFNKAEIKSYNRIFFLLVSYKKKDHVQFGMPNFQNNTNKEKYI